MIKSFLLVGLATATVAVGIGCATTGTSRTTSGTGGKSTATASSSGTGGASSSSSTSSSGGGGTGGGGTGGGYPIHCNPVTNAGCKSNQVCDYSTDTAGDVIGFRCYIASTVASLCSSCDTISCGGGTTCFYDDPAMSMTACARYCCADGDCGTGVCQFTDGTTNLLFAPAAPNLGVCVSSASVDAGAGGAAAALFSCDAPAASPSNGSCVMLTP